ncbi:MAG TPA: hypothetical protein VGP76_15370 [Planctomycetaceae bacterium]|jgi:hypothetical protein|nr:hypothetical protein [Planctomycetaceae bacterium]
MKVDYPPCEGPATAEYVLSVFQDQHRQLCALDEGDPETAISFETTVSAWCQAHDLEGVLILAVDWRGLARGLNKEWGINCSNAEWKSVLKPTRKKTLADVCQLIARHAKRPTVRPARMLGCAGRSAGAFLTIRSLLAQAGAGAQKITPSTPLEEYIRNYPFVFTGAISRLAPGILPTMCVRSAPFANIAMLCILASWIGIVFGAFGNMPLLIVASIFFFVLTGVLGFVLPAWKPATVEFGELQTFRDLAIVIAAGSK